ncbi:hypothetical protein niasHS_014421 [Heterodera schachtii]|uniref:P/Homo B domain-containing protein n=1 Tax=Heterodera schachtii TaxID=97005 RepID=A0ABD2I6T4_HETSC
MSGCQCVGLRSAAQADTKKQPPPPSFSSLKLHNFHHQNHHHHQTQHHHRGDREFVVVFVVHSSPNTAAAKTSSTANSHHNYHHSSPFPSPPLTPSSSSSSSSSSSCCCCCPCPPRLLNEDVVGDHSTSDRVPPPFIVDGHSAICGDKSQATHALRSTVVPNACKTGDTKFEAPSAAVPSQSANADGALAVPSTAKRRQRHGTGQFSVPSSPSALPSLSSFTECRQRWRRPALSMPFMLTMWWTCLLLLFDLPTHVHCQTGTSAIEDFSLHPAPRQPRRVFTNQWAVRIEGGEPAQADAIASKYGFRNLGPVIPGGDYFLFESRVVRKRSLRKVRRHLHHPTIGREQNVLWLEQQVVKKRVKRDFRAVIHRRRRHRRESSSSSLSSTDASTEQQRQQQQSLSASPAATLASAASEGGASDSAVVVGGSGGGDNTSDAVAVLRPRARHHTTTLLQRQQQQQRQHQQHPFRPPVIQNSDDEYEGEGTVAGDGPDDFLNMNRISHNDQHRTQWARLRYGVPNDPYWKDLWYLHRRDEQPDEMDHNVKEAWYLGYTGKGIVVTILDDGLERTHPDIGPNYDPDASYDVNDRDEDPTPRYEYTDENRHGTRCAGEVASIFNNSLCIVGIAFNARIGGIRMLDGDVTDAVEATSLSHNSQHIDIYSASWGPDDDGRTVDGPATLTRSAFERGITEGRQGKGSIFIWASGNGGKDADSCNCDGYTNSIHTLSISSATERGAIPWYSEACSSTLATAYSSGSSGERMIVTTDLHHSCTKSHTGTSASAPLAAGIAALTLEANPNLGWRDLQHIVVRTAKPVNLRAGDWRLNGVGRNVSHSFGYGLLDAGAMVRLAKVWHNVPKQRKCRATYPNPYKTIPNGNRLHLQVYTDGCADRREQQVKYLEHVQAIVTLSAPRRGDIQIYLTSPRGTRSTLLAKRQRDTSRTGFKEWAFMTTHNWGESAYGTWSLEIDNDGNDDAELLKWELVLHGTDVYVGPTGFEPTAAVAERSVQQQRHNGHHQSNGDGTGGAGGHRRHHDGAAGGVPSSSSSLFGLDDGDDDSDGNNDGVSNIGDSNGTLAGSKIANHSLMTLALFALGTVILFLFN